MKQKTKTKWQIAIAILLFLYLAYIGYKYEAAYNKRIDESTECKIININGQNILIPIN